MYYYHKQCWYVISLRSSMFQHNNKSHIYIFTKSFASWIILQVAIQTCCGFCSHPIFWRGYYLLKITLNMTDSLSNTFVVSMYWICFGFYVLVLYCLWVCLRSLTNEILKLIEVGLWVSLKLIEVGSRIKIGVLISLL